MIVTFLAAARSRAAEKITPSISQAVAAATFRACLGVYA